MANTFIKIASVTVGSGGQANIEFTNIPQTYSDLIILTSLRAAGVDNQLYFNNLTTNLKSSYVFGGGAATYAGADASNIQLQGSTSPSETASVFGSLMIYIHNYTSSLNKSVNVDSVLENNGVNSYQFLCAGLWSNTASITSVKLSNSSGNYSQYSTAVLYGIKSS